jgi:RNA polymerase sigma-70 factor (ECF subfamily)
MLHNRLYGKVFAFVHLRVIDIEEVKDIVQDVFLRAYKTWGDDVPEDNSAKNFLFLIARQRMIDLWRSGRARYRGEFVSKNFDDEELLFNEFDDLKDNSPLPEEIFEENENKTFLLELLNQLKQGEREILVLRFLEELEYKELARIYKTSEDNIRQKVSRSLQNLKEIARKVGKNN